MPGERTSEVTLQSTYRSSPADIVLFFGVLFIVAMLLWPKG